MSQINSYAESNKRLLYIKKCSQLLTTGILVCLYSSNKRASFPLRYGVRLFHRKRKGEL